MPGQPDEPERFTLAAAFGLYTAAFLFLASPWLSGDVEIPFDAASQFYPQMAFLARSLASGQSPFWTPNIYAGWPQIADPQSLIFSPLFFAAAWLDPAPSPRLFDALVFVLLYCGGAGVILFFRDRRWHIGGALVAALAFAFGGSAASRVQHVGQIESLMFLPLALWMLSRALNRCSWKCGLVAGVFAALIVLGRDQVSLIELYVLGGFVVWHWCSGPDRWGRFLASIKPLSAILLMGAVLTIIPVTLTALLAVHSNRPEITLTEAGKGSLHPVNLLMLVFADVFGASDFRREYWGPPGLPWENVFGATGLYVSQNTGQIYAGALVAVAVIGFGLLRGVLWAREIRFFSIALLLMLFYALGKYTPAFHGMYELIPGVMLYRRPSDATFVLCGLLAIIAGYLIHRWLTGTINAPRRWQRSFEIAIAVVLVAGAVGLAGYVGVLRDAALPILWGIGFTMAAVVVLAWGRRLAFRTPLATALLLTVFSVADLRWNNGPNESTGLPPVEYEVVRPDTKNETVRLLKEKLQATAASDRRDRVELVGVGYHWPNLGLIHDFDNLFGHNPLRLADFERATNAPDTIATPDERRFPPLMASFRSTLEDLFGVRFIAAGEPIEQIDKTLRPGDLNFVARTKDAYVYENPRALPRVLLATGWRKADFGAVTRDGRWPDIDPRTTVLLESEPIGAPTAPAGGHVRINSYHNTDVEIEADTPGGGFVVLNDVWHPWWRATVDGVPSEILKADVLFRAVVVPPGKHLVRFTFHPFAGAFDELKGMVRAAWR